MIMCKKAQGFFQILLTRGIFLDTFIGVKFSNTIELETNEIGNIVRGSVYSHLPDDKFHILQETNTFYEFSMNNLSAPKYGLLKQKADISCSNPSVPYVTEECQEQK